MVTAQARFVTGPVRVARDVDARIGMVIRAGTPLVRIRRLVPSPATTSAAPQESLRDALWRRASSAAAPDHRNVAEALARSLKPERAKRSSPVGLNAPHSPVGTPLEARPEPTPACLFVHICSDTSDGRAGGGLARTAATLLVSSSGPVWMREPPAPVASVARLCVTPSGVVDAIHA